MSVDAAVAGMLAVVGAALGLAAYEAMVRLLLPDARRASEPAAPEASRAARRRGGRVIAAVTRALDRFAPLARADADACRKRLMRAGLGIAPETWRSLRVVSCALGALVAVASLAPVFSGAPGACALAALCGAAGGWALPSLALLGRERSRRRAIEARLPDAMELMGIAMAAGSPVEQCFREVASSLDGPLADELAQVDQEVNLLGHARERALENLAERCRSQDVSVFVAQLVQAITQGSSIADGLASQAALSRATVQADALERIRKMPTKLDIVLSLCFLPPTVALVVVPTVVNLLKFLNDSMR